MSVDWKVVSAVIGGIGLLYVFTKDYRAYRKRTRDEREQREAAEQTEREREQARLEALKHPEWSIHISPTLPHDPEIPTTINSAFETGRFCWTVPLYVTNTGDKDSETFKLEVHYPGRYEVLELLTAQNMKLKPGNNLTSSLGKPGERWWRFELPWWWVLKTGATDRIGTVTFYAVNNPTQEIDDFTLFWRVISQKNRYLYPGLADYGKIPVRFKQIAIRESS
jgi:hypothetical protein